MHQRVLIGSSESEYILLLTVHHSLSAIPTYALKENDREHYPQYTQTM